MSEEIVKIGELAKELKLKSKDIVEILKNTTGAVKTVSSSLTNEEADIVIVDLAKDDQSLDVDAYIKGELLLKPVEKAVQSDNAKKATQNGSNSVKKEPKVNDDAKQPADKGDKKDQKKSVEKRIEKSEDKSAEKQTQKPVNGDRNQAKDQRTQKEKNPVEKASNNNKTSSGVNEHKSASAQPVKEKNNNADDRPSAVKPSDDSKGRSENVVAVKPTEDKKQESSKNIDRAKSVDMQKTSEQTNNNESSKKTGDRQNIRASQNPDRFIRPVEQKKLAEKKNEKNAEKERKNQQKQINATPVNTSTEKTITVTATKDLRIIDTRVSDIDLSKYDEKLLDYSSDPRHDEINAARKRARQNKMNHMKSSKNKKTEKVRASRPDVIYLPEELIVSELARELRITTGEVVKKLMSSGFMATLNSTLDFDTAAIIADEFGVRAEREVVVSIEEKLIDSHADEEDELLPRSPVVVVMGHVDHGKTSLLDAIRHTNVTRSEAGGITQHIGAYRVNIDGKDITFLDTPGHAAFTSMRARGAQVTDIAILVVAADDGIMPQTIEAINHAKAAGVDIIVAINKMDKHGVTAENIKQELTKYDLVPEEWGGDVICVPVSALTGMGINDLLENVLLVAEMADLKANPNRLAKGVVIEAKLDRGRGPVATVLVQNGTLRTGDVILAGTSVGRVRAMNDDKGRAIKEAGPSVPVEILGLSEVPSAGDVVNAVEDERMARELADQRRAEQKEDEFKANAKVSLDALFAQIQDGIKDLNIIVKADVQGSVEAVSASLVKISNEEVRVNVIHKGVGGINESDVMLASASNAIIVGFNVRPDKGAIETAERDKVDIRSYRVIYDCLEEIEAAMKGMLAPKFKEVVLGRAEVRQTIHVPNVGMIAGSYITDGKVTRNAQIRVLRDNIVIFEDKMQSLRRFKDDVKEVMQGYECGIGLERFNDIKIGDVLEAFIMEEIKD
ncbi:MAG: translation initiation factor IF-2 [Ruminococcaceae bacterium]|nr:translation initiation factor IF-2 [Oscillospiraceae bacterium]